MFAESVIQVHLSFLLLAFLAALESTGTYLESLDSGFLWFEGALNKLGDNRSLIWLSFSFSIFSATFGMAKFLKNGPVKQLPNEGYATPGFGLTMLIIVSFMTAKAIWATLTTLKHYYGT